MATSSTLLRLAALSPFLLPIAHAQIWGSTRVALSLDGASRSIDQPGSAPSTLPISSGVLLTPYNASLPANWFGQCLVGRNQLPIVKGPLPGGPPNLSQPSWSPRVELDDMSYIVKVTWERQHLTTGAATWCFSVDAASLGEPIGALPREARAGEAAADIFITPTLSLPQLPGAPVLGNALDVDGDGNVGATAFPGFGLIEQRQPGDDLDGIAFHPASPSSPNVQALTFFTLDQASAATYGYGGAHVFWHLPTAANNGTNPPFPAGTRVYMFPWQLGLNDGRDDVDALVVFENVVTGYQAAAGTLPWPSYTIPSNIPTENNIFALLWPLSGPYAFPYAMDQVFFSVTRDSQIVGSLDAQGIPIMPGDILMPPTNPSPTTTVPPRIVLAAEVLGLRTDRSFPFDLAKMDDLDALEIWQ
ncbi:MAG: hypothetical protein IPK26_04545 [Planctomycetes bacterium]|nr:hypothetical protein [Planctomycetota bacterium]